MCIYIQVLYIHKYSKGWGGGGVGWGGVGWGGVGGGGGGVLDAQFSQCYQNSPVFTHKLLVIYFSTILEYTLATVIRKSDSTIFK